MKLDLIPVIAAIVLALGAGPASAEGEDTASSILGRVDETMESLGSIRGGFRQEVEMNLMGETKRFEGRVYYRNPDFLRLEYDEPAGQLLICDGESFWMVLTDQDRPQVFKTPFAGEIGGFPSHSTIRFLLENFEARAAGRADVMGVSCYKIKFTPREGEPAIPVRDLRLFVGRQDLLPRGISYEDLAGNRIVYYFYGWTEVDHLPDRLFSYTPSGEEDLFENVFDR